MKRRKKFPPCGGMGYEINKVKVYMEIQRVTKDTLCEDCVWRQKKMTDKLLPPLIK